MYMKAWITGVFSIALLLGRAEAQGILYTWVDSDGVTHFSDSLPSTDTAVSVDITQMELPQAFTEADPDEDYYSITNQWKRAQQHRSERDRLALQREQLRLEWYRAGQEARVEEDAAVAREVDVSGLPVPVRDRPYFWWTRFGRQARGHDRDGAYPGHRHWQHDHGPRRGDTAQAPVTYSLGTQNQGQKNFLDQAVPINRSPSSL